MVEENGIGSALVCIQTPHSLITLFYMFLRVLCYKNSDDVMNFEVLINVSMS
jgi:hypothetical protein